MSSIYYFLTFALALLIAFVVLIRKAHRDYIFDRSKKYLILAILVMILFFEILHVVNIIINPSVAINPIIIWLLCAVFMVRGMIFFSRQFRYAEPIINSLLQLNQHNDIARKMQTEFLKFPSGVSMLESRHKLKSYRESFILFTKCNLNNLDANSHCVSELLAIQKKFRTNDVIGYLMIGLFISFALSGVTFVAFALWTVL